MANNIDEIKSLEECRKYVQKKLEDLRPIFAKAAIGDFSEDVPASDDDDEFTELYVGIQLMLEVIRNTVGNLKKEINYKEEVGQNLKIKNTELAQAHKAMMNILSDLQQSKSEVEKDEARYGALINSINDGIIATDKEGVIIFSNDAALNMLGITTDDFMSKNLIDAVRMEDEKGKSVPRENRIIYKTIREGKINSSADYFYFHGGKKFPVFITTSPIVLDKKVIGAVQVFRDITKDKELDKEKSEFISVASHQLRTPVTALKWLAEISSPAVKKLTPREKEYFKNLSSSIERLSKLVEDLLNVSRIELGTVHGEKISIDLVKFVDNFVEDLRPYAQLKEHQIVVEKNKIKTLMVSMDSKMLYNVFQNLISNAIDYSPAGTTVTITMESKKGEARVSIANQGQPIPPDEQKKIFQRFYRGESTKKIKTEGTGLGLYIVRANIESAGGEVGFESGEGKDTVFWFTLPAGK